MKQANLHKEDVFNYQLFCTGSGLCFIVPSPNCFFLLNSVTWQGSMHNSSCFQSESFVILIQHLSDCNAVNYVSILLLNPAPPPFECELCHPNIQHSRLHINGTGKSRTMTNAIFLASIILSDQLTRTFANVIRVRLMDEEHREIGPMVVIMSTSYHGIMWARQQKF